MEKFLIIAETENYGYFVEIHDDLEGAIKREKLFFKLAFDPPTDHGKLNKEFTSMGNYSINDQHAVFFDTVASSSNGIYSTHIIKIDDDFNFEFFALLRYSSRKIEFTNPKKEQGFLEDKYGETILRDSWVN
jgi:hypothetical protein